MHSSCVHGVIRNSRRTSGCVGQRREVGKPKCHQHNTRHEHQEEEVRQRVSLMSTHCNPGDEQHGGRCGHERVLRLVLVMQECRMSVNPVQDRRENEEKTRKGRPEQGIDPFTCSQS